MAPEKKDGIRTRRSNSGQGGEGKEKASQGSADLGKENPYDARSRSSKEAVKG